MEYSAAYAAGRLIGALLVYGAILALGFYVSRRLSARNEGYTVVRWPIGVAFGVSALLLMGQCSNSRIATSASKALPEPEVLASGDVKVVKAIVGTADGFPGEFSAEYLDAYSRDVESAMTRYLRENGAKVEAGSVVASTRGISVRSRPVLETRVSMPFVLFAYQYKGALGSNAVVITCISRNTLPFVSEETECGNAVGQVFGH